MTGFKLNIGDPVILKDVQLRKESTGTGYKVTAITKNYIECTHRTLSFGDAYKSMYYGKNDLHLIKLDKSV